MFGRAVKIRPKTISGNIADHIRGRTSAVLGTDRQPDINYWLPCRSTLVNLAVSGGYGIPGGKITEISAREGRGKSALAADFACSCLSMGGIVVYIDVEAGVSKGFFINVMGIDWNHPGWIYTCPDYAEDVFDFIEEIVVSHAQSEDGHLRPLLVIVDSIPSLCSRALAELAAKDSRQQANQASQLSRFFAKPWKQRIQGSNVFIILINQLRSALRRSRDGEEELITPGGKAIPFYAHCQLALDRRKVIFDPNKPKHIKVALGIEVTCSVTKSKNTTPFDSVDYALYTRTGLSPVLGIDDIGSCLDYLHGRKALPQKGAWFELDGLKAQGLENFWEAIITNKDPRYAEIIRDATRAVYLEERGVEIAEEDFSELETDENTADEPAAEEGVSS